MQFIKYFSIIHCWPRIQLILLSTSIVCDDAIWWWWPRFYFPPHPTISKWAKERKKNMMRKMSSKRFRNALRTLQESAVSTRCMFAALSPTSVPMRKRYTSSAECKVYRIHSTHRTATHLIHLLIDFLFCRFSFIFIEMEVVLRHLLWPVCSLFAVRVRCCVRRSFVWRRVTASSLTIRVHPTIALFFMDFGLNCINASRSRDSHF